MAITNELKTTPMKTKQENLVEVEVEEKKVEDLDGVLEFNKPIPETLVEDVKPSTKELIFLSEEDKRLLNKHSKLLMERLGINKNKSFPIPR